MPIRKAYSGGRPGYQYGQSGKVYTYQPGNARSEAIARGKAERQAAAIKANGGK